MNRKVEELAFFGELRELGFVEEVWLYGSRARGDNEERSDIDIAVNCPEASDGEWLKVMDIVEEAYTLLKIDCVRLDTLKETNPLRVNILEEGICLYKADGKE